MEEVDMEFVELVNDFLESSRDIRDAAELVDGDPIKQDMIKDILKEFNESHSRAEAVRVLVENSYPESREFILSELKEITSINNRIATKIRKRLSPLVWN
jgi:hypothetical protein